MILGTSIPNIRFKSSLPSRSFGISKLCWGIFAVIFRCFSAHDDITLPNKTQTPLEMSSRPGSSEPDQVPRSQTTARPANFDPPCPPYGISTHTARWKVRQDVLQLSGSSLPSTSASSLQKPVPQLSELKLSYDSPKTSTNECLVQTQSAGWKPTLFRLSPWLGLLVCSDRYLRSCSTISCDIMAPFAR
jgi:hypothetical protein